MDSYASSVSTTGFTKGAPSVHSVPDTMRCRHLAASGIVASHPLENRLKKWDETRHILKMESLRRLYGAAEPVRREMELRIAGADYKPAQLGGGTNLHYDILMNRDCTIEWEDIFKGWC